MTQTTSSKSYRAHHRSPRDRIRRASNILEPVEEYSVPPSRPAFSKPHPRITPKWTPPSGLDLKSYTPSLCCTTNTIRQSQPKGFIATFQTPPFSAAIETTPGYRSNYPIILSVEAFSVPRSWSIRSHSSRLSRLHPEIFVSAFVEYTRLIIPHNKQSRTPPARS